MTRQTNLLQRDVGRQRRHVDVVGIAHSMRVQMQFEPVREVRFWSPADLWILQSIGAERDRPAFPVQDERWKLAVTRSVFLEPRGWVSALVRRAER